MEDKGAFSILLLYEAARRKLSRGEFLEERIISACVYVFVRSRVGGIERIGTASSKAKVNVERRIEASRRQWLG